MRRPQEEETQGNGKFQNDTEQRWLPIDLYLKYGSLLNKIEVQDIRRKEFKKLPWLA